MNFQNPSITEIQEWAYSNEEWPNVDWPLFLSWIEDIRSWAKFATDHKCPKKYFVRYMLYYQVGKAFQSNLSKDADFKIKGFLQEVEDIKHGDIRQWIAHVRHLLAEPDTFTYHNWCEGGLAEYDFS